MKLKKLYSLLFHREYIYYGEEVPEDEERLKYITNFSGSAGYAIISANSEVKSILFSDGRYELQLKKEVDPKYLEFKKTILLVLTMIVYGATILKVGFFLSTSLFLVFSYYFLGERRWKYIIIFSFPFVAIFMYLLHGVLAVYLRDPLLKYIGIMG